MTAAMDQQAQSRPAVYFDDTANVWVYRASAVSGCSKALVLARLGHEGEAPPASMQRRFDDGHLHEPAILAEVDRRTAWNVKAVDPLTQEQWRLEIDVLPATDDHPGVIIRQHLDGMGFNPAFNPDARVIEAKALAESGYKAWLANRFRDFPYYASQITLAMYATGVPALYAVKNKNSGEVDVFEVAEPPDDIERILTRIRVIEAWGRRGHIPDDCDVKQYPCPFYRHHTDEQQYPDGYDPDSPDRIIAAAFGEAPADEAVDADYETSADLLLAQYDQARADEKEAGERKKEIARRIEERVLADRDSFETAAFKVAWKNHTHRWLDEDEMRRDGINPDDYRRERFSRYVNVTAKRKAKR